MILFLYGDDIFRKNQKLAQAKERFIREVDPSKMNLLTIEASDADEETLRGKLLASPFLARKRMVVLRNFLGESRRKGTLEVLLNTLQSVGENTVVVISEDRAKPKKWKNEAAKTVWEYLAAHAQSEEFKQLWGARLEKEILAQAKAHGLVMRSDAAALLAIMTGGDLGQVEQELQKLIAYLNGYPEPRRDGRGEGSRANARAVTADDVKEVCVAQGGANIFALLDALGAKDKTALLRALEEQFGQSEAGQLISQITAHLRALLAVTLKGDAGAQALRLHPFQFKKIQSQVRNWDAPTLKKFLFRILALDYSIKRGLAADPRAQLTAILARTG